MNKPAAYSRPTIADVAQQAGVSPATVSRVINQSGYVSEDTAQRVQSAIEQLNYKPYAAARLLASRRTFTIGLVLDEINGEYFPPMLRGIETMLHQAGYDLLIHSTSHAPIPGRYAVGEHNTDGLLVFANSLPDDELRRLKAVNLPVVLLHRSAPAGEDIPCVIFENKQGARRMVDHLIRDRGCRRIGFLTGQEGHEDAYWREVGYRESLAAHDIPFDPSLVREGGFNEEIAQQTVSAWIEQGFDADAIFAADDESAIGAILALQAAGLRIPEDVAVVGFDDIRLAGYINPPLTTVRAPIEAAGRKAVEMLVQLIQDGRTDPLALLPVDLVIRRSCGHP